MRKRLLNEYTEEKNNIKKFLIGSRMISVSYSETFNLLFKQNFQNDELNEIQIFICKIGNLSYIAKSLRGMNR